MVFGKPHRWHTAIGPQPLRWVVENPQPSIFLGQTLDEPPIVRIQVLSFVRNNRMVIERRYRCACIAQREWYHRPPEFRGPIFAPFRNVHSPSGTVQKINREPLDSPNANLVAADLRPQPMRQSLGKTDQKNLLSLAA